MTKFHPDPLSPYPKLVLVILAVSAAVCGFLILAVALHTLPLTDDTCRASFWPLKPHAGLLAYLGFTYFGWSGRWAGVGLEVALLAYLPVARSYPWMVTAIILVDALLLFGAVRQFFSKTLVALGVFGLLGAVYYSTMPGAREGLYWLTGAAEYEIPSALAVMLLAMMLSPMTTQWSRSRTALACSLAFMVPAFHELLGAMLVFTLSAATAVVWRLKRPTQGIWMIVSAAAWISFLIVVLAPGNPIRMKTFPTRANYAITWSLSIGVVQHTVIPWFYNPKHWLFAFLVWIDPRILTLRKQLPGLGSATAIALFCCSWVCLILTGVVATTWNTGLDIPGRTLNLMYCVFLAGWMVTAFLLSDRISAWQFLQSRRGLLGSICLVALCGLILTSQTPIAAVEDLRDGRLQAWDAQLNQRIELLKTAPPHSDQRVERLLQYPRSYQPWDITEDPKDWRNRCYAQTFGGGTVRLLREHENAK